MPRSKSMIGLVFLTFFVMSLLTNIPGPILPEIIGSFHVSLTAAGFLAFAFFYCLRCDVRSRRFSRGTISRETGDGLRFPRQHNRRVSFALFPGYRVAFASWFVIGTGMAILQVAVNPLLRVAGGEENYSYNSTLAQLVFGSASFISPRIYSYLVLGLNNPATGQNALLRILRKLTPAQLRGSRSTGFLRFVRC
jgi:FHS family L-fucose permease-like MFS transporter